MSDKKNSHPPGAVNITEITPEHIRLLQEDNQKLAAENIQLKKSLEKEQFLHNNLYKEWKQLKESTAINDTDIRQPDTTSSWIFSKASFYVLLFITLLLLIFALYNLRR